MKVKICGIKNKEEIKIINRYRPDYVGFIVDHPASFRSLTIEQVRALAPFVDPKIQKVGVFVDASIQTITELLEEGIFDLVQLHGGQDADFIEALRRSTSKPIIQVLKRKEAIAASIGDHILLDPGKGEGKRMDWTSLASIDRPFWLAGGIDLDNIDEAMSLHPDVIDLASGSETDRKKDPQKIKAILERVRGKENE